MLKEKVIIKNQNDQASLMSKMEENKAKVEYNVRQEMEVKKQMEAK